MKQRLEKSNSLRQIAFERRPRFEGQVSMNQVNSTQ
jgi:hypothetical protein